MQLRVLGPLQVSNGDQVWSPGGPKERRLLAILVLHLGEVVSVETLAEALWEGATPRTGVKTVQVYVTRLRAALATGRPDGDLVQTVGRGYRLALSADAVDAYAFVDLVRRARQAVDGGVPQEAERYLVDAFALWRGEPYGEFADGASFAAEAQRLAETRLAGLEVGLAAGLAVGRDAEVVAEAQALCAAYPLHEQFWVHLATGLYRCGRQADALAALRRVRAVLAEEIGADPGVELRTLEQRVLRQDPTLATPTLRGAAAAVEDEIAKAANGQPRVGEHLGARLVGERSAQRGDAATGQARPAGEAPIDPPMINLAGSANDPAGGVRPVPPVEATGQAAAAPPTRRSRRARKRTRWVAALAAAVVVAGTVTGLVAGRTDRIALAAGDVVSSLTARGKVVTQLPVGNNPTAVTAADGTVWVTNTADDTVSRIDPVHGRERARITGVGHHPSAIAVGDGTAWVVSPEDNTVTPINTTIERTVGVSVPVGQRPAGVAVGAGRVWVTNSVDNTVSVINRNDLQHVRTDSAGTGPSGIAVAGDAVWVTNAGDGTVWKLDPGTGYRLLDAKVGDDPVAVAVGASGVWVANYLSDTVTRLDPATGEPTSTIPVGPGPSGIAVTDNAVWVTADHAGQVVAIDSHTNRVTRRVAVAGAPHGIAALDDRLWLASGPSYLGHRGGLLRVRTAHMPDVEPARAGASDFVPSLTHDGLVSYAHTGGAAGATIVADLADAVPPRSGTLYVFRLRPGIRYDTGVPLRARDVRYSLERLFRVGKRGFAGDAESGFSGIVGAAACLRRPATCDLSHGVQTDDTAGTVRIRLTRPNPLFLNWLAELFDVVPYGTPLTDVARGRVPGTGPYTVTRFVSNRVELGRNPYFQPWSRAAQPDGYPDSIVVDIGPTTAATVDQLVRGQLDFVLPGDAQDLAPATVRAAALGHRLQLVGGSALVVGMAILNTRIPPFNDLRVRKALNYAVDRGELARRRMAIGEVIATTTCQVLIPGIAGYRPYCPYTAGQGSGRWLAPEMNKAHELVRESGTVGQQVTVWEPATRYDPDGAYFVEVLNALGYKAHLHLPRPDFTSYVDHVLTPGNAQLAVLAWSSAPRGDDLTQHLLCNFDSNFGGYCDPRIDRDYNRAVQLAVSDPTHANQLWADIDQRLVDAAPWVPAWNTTTIALASARVGNITPHFLYDILLDQLWVQ